MKLAFRLVQFKSQIVRRHPVGAKCADSFPDHAVGGDDPDRMEPGVFRGELFDDGIGGVTRICIKNLDAAVFTFISNFRACLLYTSDAADE